MNLADSNKLSEDARLFVDGGTRSLGTCALANHLANAGFSMANGFLVGTFCGWQWGLFTTVFSLLGLWYLGELIPKMTAAKAPEEFLNKHARKLLAAKALLAPIVERIVAEEPRCEVKENEIVNKKVGDVELILAKTSFFNGHQTVNLIFNNDSKSIQSIESYLNSQDILEMEDCQFNSFRIKNMIPICGKEIINS